MKYLLATCLFLLASLLNIASQSADEPALRAALYAIYLPDSNAAEALPGKQDLKIVDGIVFYKTPIWQPENDPKDQEKWSEYRDEYAKRSPGSAACRLEHMHIMAKHLYLWGCLNSVDISNPLWGGGDGYRNFFIGDTAGTLSISYESGLIDVIPLVFGYTAWWHDNYQAACEPFRSDSGSRKELSEALCVVNGLDGYRRDPDDYYVKIVLRNEPVSWIELSDNPDLMGYYRVDGLTFGNPLNVEDLPQGNYILKEGMPISRQRADSIRDLLVFSADPYPGKRHQAVMDMRHKYSTFLVDINETTIQETTPEVLPEDFPGPKINFSGSPVATLLTRIYYENANQLPGRIDADGMVHESAYKADNYQGFAGWIPELGAFYTDSYTRIRALTILSHMGFEEKVNAAIAFFDKWMMYFPNSFPDVQLGGKPVPGHATVIANKPHIYYNFLRGLGWRTIYESPDFGNPENDGHGLLMITRWRAWLKQGRTRAWVEERWEAINEAAEYVPWCLDNPELSHSKHGLLHNETEGGMMGQSMYCDYICYLGLLGYAQMAEVSGRKEKANRWKQQADRLLAAMEAYYPEKIEPWGDVWNPQKNAIFSYIHSTLAPACIGMDFYGYDVMKNMPDDWAKRTRNTYEMQLTRNRPAYAAPAGMGYGQCYITQTGLLLDEMEDADKMLEWLAHLCFTPRLKHPYRVPEGAIISEDGSTWRRWGDLGNLYQLADVVHTIVLMTGIDDIDPSLLTLMPRLPASINKIEVLDWPIRTMSQKESTLSNIDMEMMADTNTGQISYHLVSSLPIDQARLRLGPISPGTGPLKLTQNDTEIPFTRIRSGDADWVWVSFGGDSTKEYNFRLSY